MTNSLKDIYNNLDLYGSQNFIIALKLKFKAVAFTENSMPTMGSPCKPSSFVRDDLSIIKAVFHRNNEVTVKTDRGYLKFF
jgi:hypothetical protein